MKTTALFLVSGLALAGCGQSNKNASNGTAANNAQAITGNAQVGADNGQNAAGSGAGGQTSGAMTPDQVRARMQRDGVTQTMTAFEDPSFSATNGAMSEGIASGDEQWLALVPLLSTTGHAEGSEGLTSDLAAALPRNAAGVLRVLSDRQTVDFFKEGSCFPPDEMSGQAARTYIETATRAVEAVNDPALQTAKARCLANLRTARSRTGS